MAILIMGSQHFQILLLMKITSSNHFAVDSMLGLVSFLHFVDYLFIYVVEHRTLLGISPHIRIVFICKLDFV